MDEVSNCATLVILCMCHVLASIQGKFSLPLACAMTSLSATLKMVSDTFVTNSPRFSPYFGCVFTIVNYWVTNFECTSGGGN